MMLEFHKRRHAKLKGNYLYQIGAGKVVELVFGKPQEVDDEIATRILHRDGDIVKRVEKKKRKPKNVKMVEDSVIEQA